MRKTTARRLAVAAESIGGLDFRVDSKYSGRGMFGKTTTAFVCEPTEFMSIVLEAAHDFEDCDSHDENTDGTWDEFVADITTYKSDDMGRDQKVYY